MSQTTFGHPQYPQHSSNAEAVSQYLDFTHTYDVRTWTFTTYFAPLLPLSTRDAHLIKMGGASTHLGTWGIIDSTWAATDDVSQACGNACTDKYAD